MKHPAFWTWPDLRVTVHVLPWHWKLKPSWHASDYGVADYCSLRWLGVDIEWYGLSPDEKGGWFPMEEDL